MLQIRVARDAATVAWARSVGLLMLIVRSRESGSAKVEVRVSCASSTQEAIVRCYLEIDVKYITATTQEDMDRSDGETGVGGTSPKTITASCRRLASPELHQHP